MENVIGGTHTLFWQIGTLSNGSGVAVERYFSVVPDFESGGTKYDLTQLPDIFGKALENRVKQLNSTSGTQNTWSLSGCYLVDRNRFGFTLRCVRNANEMDQNKSALVADLGPKAMRAIYIRKEGSKCVIKFDLPVNELPSPSTRIPYNQLDPVATGVVTSLVAHANKNERDLTKHPWALLGVWGLSSPAPPAPAPAGVLVILQWQPLRRHKVAPVASIHGGQLNISGQNGGAYVVKYKLKATSPPPFNRMEVGATGVIASLVSDANSNDQD